MHVIRLIKGGQLPGKKLGHDWIVFSLDYKRKRKPKKSVSGQANSSSKST
jgi:hypothetical protein